MPNSHGNSRLMRVQNDTADKITAIAAREGRAANAQLALIVDEWMRGNGWEVQVDPSVRPARTDAPSRPGSRARTLATRRQS